MWRNIIRTRTFTTNTKNTATISNQNNKHVNKQTIKPNTTTPPTPQTSSQQIASPIQTQWNKQTNKHTTNPSNVISQSQSISPQSTNISIKPQLSESLFAYHYLPLNPTPLHNQIYLPVSQIKPSPVSQPPLGSRTVPSRSSYESEPFPRWLIVTFLALSVPFAVFARDDWRAKLIEQTEAYINWPEWFRVHDLTKIDYSLSNDRHFDNLFKQSKSSTPSVSSPSKSQLVEDKYLPQLNAARLALIELCNNEIAWVRSQESPEERAARLRKEEERQFLIDEILRLEDAIRAATSDAEKQVEREIARAESEARAQFLQKAQEWMTARASQIDQKLNLMAEQLVSSENESFVAALDVAVNAARKQEVEFGVRSIQKSLTEAESVYEQATRAMLAEDSQRFMKWTDNENDVRESILSRSRAAFESVKHEYEDLQDYVYLSSNIHRVNLAVMAIEEALSNTSDPASHKSDLFNQWRTLISAGHSDPVIGSAIGSLSNESLHNGLASYDELHQRWKQSEFSLFTAAYDSHPSQSSLVSHILSMLAAIFTIKSHDLVDAKDDITRLQRCGYWSDHPDVGESSSAKLYQEISGLSDKVRQTIDTTFLRRLSERATAEVALSAIKARIQTLEIAFIPADK